MIVNNQSLCFSDNRSNLKTLVSGKLYKKYINNIYIMDTFTEIQFILTGQAKSIIFTILSCYINTY